MAIVAESIAPSDSKEVSLSKYVARALQVAAETDNVKYRLGPMFTTLEGDLADCLEIVRKMHEALADMGVQRIGSVIKIDDRRDISASMDNKVRSVIEKM